MDAASRIVAVGTTSVRAIESAARGRDRETDLFIYPGFEFRRTGAMLTNFHLPKSSLLVLVSAFLGTELALAAYLHAVEKRYRFFSYGDCMLIVSGSHHWPFPIMVVVFNQCFALLNLAKTSSYVWFCDCSIQRR